MGLGPMPALGRKEGLGPSCCRCAGSPAGAAVHSGLWNSPGSWAAPVASALWENLTTHSPVHPGGDPGPGEGFTLSNLIRSERAVIVSFVPKSSASPGVWVSSWTQQCRPAGKWRFPGQWPQRPRATGEQMPVGPGGRQLAGCRVCPALHLPGAGALLRPFSPSAPAPVLWSLHGDRARPEAPSSPPGAPRRPRGFTAVSAPFQCSGRRR